MSHMALYRKWRPLTFEDVVEQRHIVTTLKNSIINNTISHAYLLCGTRGTGKTTLAKILSRAINCLNPNDGSPCNECITCRGILDGSIIDVIEIDAASNNGVDDIREIKEAVMYVPAITRYKVYIIDEVHMLSTGAFNALLKTLEEPPENVIFILATTEPHKLPATILSRCQRFDFKRITISGLTGRLKIISGDCGVSFEDEAINLIAQLSEGGMRDAISLLDQLISLGKPTVLREDVVAISGLTSYELVNDFAGAIIRGDSKQALYSIKIAMDEGRDLQPLCTQLIDWFRSIMLIKTGGESLNLIEVGDEELIRIKKDADEISLEHVLTIIKELSETESRLKWAENQRILFEVSAIKLCSRLTSETGKLSDNINSQLELRIQQLEQKLVLINDGKKPDANFKKPQEVQMDTQKQADVANKGEGVKGTDLDTYCKDQLKKWPDVIEYVRSTGKMKVFAYLLDTKCILVNESTATIIVPSDDGLKKTVLTRNDSLEVIQDALEKVTGLKLVIKVIDDKSFNDNKSVQESDPALDKIIQFANENNIPLDIKD